jgi:hypothetical protein
MPNSRGSISALHQQNCELDSVVYSVRVRVDDLAIISSYLIKSGFVPKSGGHAASMGLVILSEWLVASGKSKKFDLQEAKKFCESMGIATGTRRNIRVFGSQSEPPQIQQFATPEEIEGILRKITEEKSSNVCIEDLSVPKEDERLLSELEAGKPNIVEE